MRLPKLLLFLGFISLTAMAQEVVPNNQNKFDDVMYRRGNEYRAASGVPGDKY